MALRPRSWYERRLCDRAQAFWTGASARPDAFSLGRLKDLRKSAKTTRAALDLFLQRTEALALSSRASLAALPLPAGTDWRWRPTPFNTPIIPAGIAAVESPHLLGHDTTLWHDCPRRAVILRQVPNLEATDLSPLGLRLEAFGFSGSFLSLSFAMPDEVLAGLDNSHIIRVETQMSSERPMKVYLRLNIGHGPNIEEELRELPALTSDRPSQQVTEFDLAYIEMNTERLERVWLDLIFEAPAMNQVDLRDIYLSRHLRADM